jgi:alkylation response protein AidB-like acyl-CoA dehydrogenase
MVEKIKRDVRITTIYEGTSEILEMTIARDRWQLHLKTRGEAYHDEARRLEELARAHPEVGADTAALACHALAELLERSRLGRLTRHQHVLLRLGELIAWTEGAASFARRAACAARGELDAKADRRFSAADLATLARVFAREAALKVAAGGLGVVGGALDAAGEAEGLAAAVGLPAVYRAQAGALADLDRAAAAVYGRA